MRKIIIKCHTVVEGIAEGGPLVTKQPLCLYDSLDPKSGRIVNRRHELYGEEVTGKILIFPHGIGSSTSAATILEASRCKKAPRAIVNMETDPVVAVGSVLAGKLYGQIIPIVDRPAMNLIELVKSDDRVRVDANQGLIELIRRKASS